MCEDTNDFWICRILKNINEDYEKEDGTWLLERNKIDKYDFVKFMNEKTKHKMNLNNKLALNSFISHLQVNKIVNNLITLDDTEGLENWDCKEYQDYNEIIEDIDAGYGIITL